MQQCCSKKEKEVTQKTVGWKKSSVLQFPREIVLGPEQIKAINSERRVILLMGEAGTGKTTVLLATLFKYTGKHVVEEDRKKVMFSIPHHKKTLKNDIFSFIKHFCVRKWVEIVLGFDVERVCRNTGSTVYLFDEIYDTQFVSRILMRGKIYAVVIPGEKMTFELKNFHSTRSDLELIHFRKIYRTPAKISRCCVKLKRLLDEEKYKKKNQVKAHSLDYNSTYQDIPWEMSFSNSMPLREGNDIEIKSYQSLQMVDLKKCIGQSDLIVTLNLEKEKVQEMDLLFDTNTVFHENSEANCHNERAAVGRSSGDGGEIIVLICAKNFRKESLTSQQGLLRYIELKQCVVHVICDYRVTKEVEHFSFNFGSWYIYEEPFESESCFISLSKLSEKTQIITFCQTMDAVKLINSYFPKLAALHINVENTCLKRSEYIEGKKNNEKSHQNAMVEEIVLVFGSTFRNELPVMNYWPCLVNLVHEGCSLTLITDDFTLDASECTSALFFIVEELKRYIVEGLEKSLNIQSLVSEEDIRVTKSNDLTELVNGVILGIIDQKLIELFNESLIQVVIDDLSKLIDDDLITKLIDKASQNLAEDLAAVVEKSLIKLVDETLTQVVLEKLPELVNKNLTIKPLGKRNWGYDKKFGWKLGDKTLETILSDAWWNCCKKYAIRRFRKTLRKFNDTFTKMLPTCEINALERIIGHIMEFDRRDLEVLFETETFFFTLSCSYNWVSRNLHIFNEEALRSAVFEELRTSFDHKLQTEGMKNARAFVRTILHKTPEVEINEWLRRNVKIFNKEVLRSLLAKRYFACGSLANASRAFMCDFPNPLTRKNLRTLIITHSANFLNEEIKKWLCGNSSNVNETVLSSVNNKWIDLDDGDLKTLIGEYFGKIDDQSLKKWSRFLVNIEFLRILSDENERRGHRDEIFREIVRSEMTDESPGEVIDDFLESINETLTTLVHDYINWSNKPIKQMWESARQSNFLALSPNSAQFNHLLPLFNHSEGNRLVITFDVNEKTSELLDCFFCNDRVIHTDDWYDLENCCLSDKQEFCHWFGRARDSPTVKKMENYDTTILVISRKMNAPFTLSDFVTAFCSCSNFIILGDKEVHDRHVNTEFQFNGRPFLEILQYSDSSTNDEILELIPRFEQQNTLLLAWNVDKKLSQDIEETFAQYEFKRIPGTPQAEPFCQQTKNQEIDIFIMVCGKLKGKTYLSEKILDKLTDLGIKRSIYIVCHSINTDHIKSVFLSCNKYNFLERKIWPNLSQEPIDVGSTIPTIEANKETKVLILTWNISPDISSYVDKTFQNCTFRRIDAPLDLLEDAYDEVILVCGAPLEINAIASGLRSFSRCFRFRCNFYLVSDQNCYAQIALELPTERAFHFSLNFYFFGDSIIDQIGKIPVLKKQRDPNVLLVTLNLDKNTALDIDTKFSSYTTKHVDLMPWSSDSLSFTGSEFDKVVVICNEQTNAQSRETKSVLYNALTRAKQKVTVFCHENTESHFRKLLSLSSTDQTFHKIRSFDSVGEKLTSYLENQHDILEAFKRIIVSKNVAQFNSLEKFVSECNDPSFNWVFDSVQSMLVRCLPWGLEIVHMLNKFLSWRPALRSEVNIFSSPSFFCGNVATKEERVKLLEGIAMDLRSTNLKFDEMDTTKLKNVAFSAVTWNQMALFDEVFQRLKDILSLHDDYFVELLHHAIVLNEIEYVGKVVKTIWNKESRIFCLLKQTAPFIDEAIFSKLVTSVCIPSDVFLTQNLSKEPFQTMIHYFASTATTQCFEKLLSFLPKRSVNFSAFNLQDDLGRNVLTSAVCNSEIFQMILNRAEQQDSWRRNMLISAVSEPETFHLILNRAGQQDELDVLLSQKDSKGWSCLRHACNADNIDVVKLLVRKYSFNYKDDVDSEGVPLIDFAQVLGRNHIKNFLSRLRTV